MTTTTGALLSPNLGFASLQDAVGQSAVTDFLAYDSLGTPVTVRVTAVLESLSDNSTTYRWFADSGDNSPASGAGVAVGTGLITFDGSGKLASTTNDSVSVHASTCRRLILSFSTSTFRKSPAWQCPPARSPPPARTGRRRAR